MAVMLGGLALGFAASRFLKASSERRQRDAGRSRVRRAGLHEPAPGPRVRTRRPRDRARRRHAAGARRPPTSASTRPGRPGRVAERGRRAGPAHAMTAQGHRTRADRSRRAGQGPGERDLDARPAGDRARPGRVTQKGKTAGKGAGMLGGAARLRPADARRADHDAHRRCWTRRMDDLARRADRDRRLWAPSPPCSPRPARKQIKEATPPAPADRRDREGGRRNGRRPGQ